METPGFAAMFQDTSFMKLKQDCTSDDSVFTSDSKLRHVLVNCFAWV